MKIPGAYRRPLIEIVRQIAHLVGETILLPATGISGYRQLTRGAVAILSESGHPLSRGADRHFPSCSGGSGAALQSGESCSIYWKSLFPIYLKDTAVTMDRSQSLNFFYEHCLKITPLFQWSNIPSLAIKHLLRSIPHI